ncbi:protein PAT1 homolog 2 isoform X4 [Mobula hypostoma]|uniref:protein PAT1 homolog 2 isoform X4 n=1 Tax=Mobula hypostoma TaxID=723540 RepID=UPI002FC28AF5
MELTESGEVEEFPLPTDEGYLQEMKDDEDIDLYNEETFGIDSESGAELSEDLSLLCEALGASHSKGAEEMPQAELGLESHPFPEKRVGKSPDQDPKVSEGPSAAQELSDPAVMEAIHGQPSLESLDSAIVDSGVCSGWEEFNISHILDSALLKSMEETAMLETARSPLVPHFPGSPGMFRPHVRQQRGPPSHCPLRMPSGSVPPLPFRPLSPMLPGRKLMTMRFGSPSPSAYFSSSPKLLEAFRFPGRVTQLHPQHSRILSQRQQRMRRESTKEPNAGVDAFGKLMTDKEKAWIIKLQMIQLQSENPHLDDYYYQEFFRKLELKLQDEELGKDVKREPQKLVTPYVQKAEMYDSVVHIEGSLGQVAVSTCYSPRRAIDVVHVLTLEEDPPNLGRQRLHLLDNIEKMYQLLLELEEMETHLVSVPEEKRLMYQSLRDRKLEQLYQRLHVGIREENSELFRILRVRKGIKLLSRLLPLLPPTRCTEILFSVAASLHQLGKEGMDEFSLSFLYVLLSHGESLLSLSCLTEPCVEDFQHWTDIIFLVARELSQTPKSSMAEPLQLPSNLLPLFCRYVDKQTAHTLEDKIEFSVSDSCSRM